ncbi:MAG: hypothetical protein KKI01_07415 [Proteobacteria bacterium]|jgi:hypothetical protein|nr:hypothetical protein [Pseudomonadota bacterium]
MKDYTQLTIEQRYQTFSLKIAAFNRSRIANNLQLHKSPLFSYGTIQDKAFFDILRKILTRNWPYCNIFSVGRHVGGICHGRTNYGGYSNDRLSAYETDKKSNPDIIFIS